MKQDPSPAHVEGRMRPGVIAKDGFLGEDTRTLSQILSEDEAEVRRLGLDHRRIADRLRRLMEEGAKGLGTEVPVEGRFLVTVDDARGRVPCPWPGDGSFPKTIVHVKKIATGETMMFSALNVHLIEAHGFYEGRGSHFRLDPARIRSFFNL